MFYSACRNNQALVHGVALRTSHSGFTEQRHDSRVCGGRDKHAALGDNRRTLLDLSTRLSTSFNRSLESNRAGKKAYGGNI